MTELNEALPKSGHVNEVCKKWVLHEDGALAYQLQSQEINEFYQGNKFRNAVVRQDFPTALNEQIKEKENAERQAALYHQMIAEQEQADAKVARQLSRSIENDLRQKELEEVELSESIARQLQSVYVETGIQVKNPLPLPARNPCSKYSASNAQHQNNAKHNKLSRRLNSPIDDDDYDEPVLINHLEQIHFTNNRNIEQHTPEKTPPLQTYHMNRYTHTPEKQIPFDNEHFKPNIIANSCPVDSYGNASIHEDILLPYSDVADSIRQYDLSLSNCKISNRQPVDNNDVKVIDQTGSYKKYKAIHDDQLIRNNSNLQKFSPENYDYIMGNYIAPEQVARTVALTSPGHNGNNNNNNQLPNVVPSKNSTLLVKNLDDAVRIAALQELGLPTNEIKEIDKKIQQEKHDEELARKLQQEEAKASMTQEEKDRLLAIEAQDKELARMLQEREKAKAKRAREKARLRKQQKLLNNEDPENQTSPVEPHSALQYQPNYVALDHDSYSNPVDLVASTQGSLPGKKLSANSEYKLSEIENQLDIKDDNIYTLPFDSEVKKLNRPVVDKARNVDTNISMNRGVKQLEKTENIAAMIDPTYPNSGNTTLSSTHSMSMLDESSSPVPPYMPIQGTRRNTVDKKKKSKDKCTHQ